VKLPDVGKKGRAHKVETNKK